MSKPVVLPLVLAITPYLLLYIQFVMFVFHMVIIHGWPWDPKPFSPTVPQQPNQACITWVTWNLNQPTSFCWNTTQPGSWSFDPASGQFVQVTNQTQF